MFVLRSPPPLYPARVPLYPNNTVPSGLLVYVLEVVPELPGDRPGC